MAQPLDVTSQASGHPEPKLVFLLYVESCFAGFMALSEGGHVHTHPRYWALCSTLVDPALPKRCHKGVKNEAMSFRGLILSLWPLRHSPLVTRINR